MIFFAAVARFASNVGIVAAIRPAFQQIEPILQAIPENILNETKVVETLVQGDIHFDRVSFQYDNDSEWAIDDITLRVKTGEFVAIVGESGSGKSTVFKLLLGLETPTSGAIFYESHDLNTLNLISLRRQIGVVAQNVSLQSGTILQNIIGTSTGLGIDDAWEAARLAHVDQDIEQMDMQMLTPISSDSKSFSGGQIQRIVLASALVNRPRVILLDEATNWLDNRTQAEVMRSINNIATTRIVIAHRLSTIQEADRIYVMKRGKIVQSGTFSELAEIPGMFHDLTRRQFI